MQAKKQSNAGTKRLADGKKRPLPDCYQKSGAKENAQHALRTGLIRKHVCKICGKEHYYHGSICGECRKKFLYALERSVTRASKMSEIQASISEITEKDAKMLTLWNKGVTLQKIGEKFGCTKQNVFEIINKYRK